MYIILFPQNHTFTAYIINQRKIYIYIYLNAYLVLNRKSPVYIYISLILTHADRCTR
ncbi:hypothetical protein CLU79DRAFT_727291 [Phycomyces nitens]|nr:hypothetical protein CLU79DRAFT_727291 [Phycomyces nitens]